MKHTHNYTRQRITKKNSIRLNGDIDEVFPLFGALEEQKWLSTWKPYLIYSQTGKDEKNMVFKTTPRLPDTNVNFYWVMTEFSRERHVVSYAIFSTHHITTIEIRCAAMDLMTKADVTYNFTSLDEHGIELIKKMADSIFQHELKDWQEGINNYLKGKN
jgi:hypothetical protein